MIKAQCNVTDHQDNMSHHHVSLLHDVRHVGLPPLNLLPRGGAEAGHLRVHHWSRVRSEICGHDHHLPAPHQVPGKMLLHKNMSHHGPRSHSSGVAANTRS